MTSPFSMFHPRDSNVALSEWRLAIRDQEKEASWKIFISDLINFSSCHSFYSIFLTHFLWKHGNCVNAVNTSCNFIWRVWESGELFVFMDYPQGFKDVCCCKYGMDCRAPPSDFYCYFQRDCPKI
jgi:hypothetical protein